VAGCHAQWQQRGARHSWRRSNGAAVAVVRGQQEQKQASALLLPPPTWDVPAAHCAIQAGGEQPAAVLGDLHVAHCGGVAAQLAHQAGGLQAGRGGGRGISFSEKGARLRQQMYETASSRRMSQARMHAPARC
jgi:hypothetical protein